MDNPCPKCKSTDIFYSRGTGVDLNTQYNGPYIMCLSCKFTIESKHPLRDWKKYGNN